MTIDTSGIEITDDDYKAVKRVLLAARDVVHKGTPFGPNATDEELATRLHDALRTVAAEPIAHVLVTAALWCEHRGSDNETAAFERLSYAIHRLETL